METFQKRMETMFQKHLHLYLYLTLFLVSFHIGRKC